MKPTTTSADMKLIQGTWERQIQPDENVPYKRCVRAITDGHEVVSYFGEDGAMTQQHSVDFRLEQHGPVKVFTFFNHEILAGKDMGKRTPEPRSYIYRLNGDELAEVWGFLPGQEGRISYHTHRRIKDESSPATQPTK